MNELEFEEQLNALHDRVLSKATGSMCFSGNMWLHQCSRKEFYVFLFFRY